MKKEKIIKQQAREALKGNLTVLLTGILAAAVVAILLENLLYVIALPTGIIDAETEKAAPDKLLWCILLITGITALGLIASPLINGLLRAAGNAVIHGKCTVGDLLYFFGGGRLYKTVGVNIGLICLFSVATLPPDLAAQLLTGDSVPLLWSAASVVWKVFVWMILVHYPLAAYALDDRQSVPRVVFGYIGFSFRCLGALLALLFSMLGWIALCFFVVPVIYVGPYLLTAMMNSARWLLAARKP